MIVRGSRASAILFQFLASGDDRRPVIAPANVCAVVPQTIEATGRQVAFADIDPITLALDLDEVAALVARQRDHFGAVIIVRPYGRIDDISAKTAELRRIQPDLSLIDDRCLARPSTGLPCPPWADLALYSTGYGKYVDLGGGGYGSTGAGGEASARAMLRAPAPAPAWLTTEPAPSSQEDVLAVEGACREMDAHKAAVNALYETRIPAEATLGPRFNDWRFNLRVAEPDTLVRRLFAAGLFASRHYPVLPAAGEPAGFPRAEALHAQVVNLFNDRHFTEEQARTAAGIVAGHVAEFGLPPPA